MGSLITFPLTPKKPDLRIVQTAPAGCYGYSEPEREPDPDFEIDRRRGEIVWRLNGLRIVHSAQVTALADVFSANGWKRNFNALIDAEERLSEPKEAR
jgi:hypothetical protein